MSARASPQRPPSLLPLFSRRMSRQMSLSGGIGIGGPAALSEITATTASNVAAAVGASNSINSNSHNFNGRLFASSAGENAQDSVKVSAKGVSAGKASSAPQQQHVKLNKKKSAAPQPNHRRDNTNNTNNNAGSADDGGRGTSQRRCDRLLRIPLWSVFLVQLIVVAAAFAIAIAVLSEQQQREFGSSLNKQLSLQQRLAIEHLVNPLLDQQTLLEYYLDGYVNRSALRAQAAEVALDPNHTSNGYPMGHPLYYAYPVPGMGTTVSDALTFYDTFSILASRNSAVTAVVMANESDYRTAAAPNATTWAAWVVDATGFYVASREVGSMCSGRWPITINAKSCPPYTFAFDTASMMGTPTNTSGVFSAPIISYSEDGIQKVDVGYSISPNAGRSPKQVVVISFQHMTDVITSALASSSDSIAAVFSTDYRALAEGRQSSMFVITGKYNFPHDPLSIKRAAVSDLVSNSSNKFTAGDSTWKGGETPDAVLNVAYAEAQRACYPQSSSSSSSSVNPCAYAIVFDVEVDGSQYATTAVRYSSNAAALDWLFVQYTPRDVFYGTSDRARLMGIVIGIVGALIVLATCVLIWLAIKIPLRQLNANMDLAAEMLNDQVTPMSPVLLEVHDMAEAFRSMNLRLLKARPFLPQSLLHGILRDDDDGDDGAEGLGADDDDEEEEEGYDVRFAFRKSGRNYTDTDNGNESCSTTNSRSLNNKQGGDDTGNTRARRTPQHAGLDINGASHLLESNTIISHTNTHTTATTGGGSGSLTAAVTSKKLEFRRVGVLAININGFQAATAPLGNYGMADAQSLFTRLVETAAQEERGIVDYFHGDHFVCGFNTARMCGNAARNAAMAGLKVNDRFNAHPKLSARFPLGLSMGMSAGRAAVGNHGTDTMQRLATIGPAFTEAVRLQQLMARRVLYSRGAGGGKGVTTSALNLFKNNAFNGYTHQKQHQHQHDDGGSTANTNAQPCNTLLDAYNRNMLGGRLLTIGRALQDVEHTVAFQIIGGIDASELLPSSEARDARLAEEYARMKNGPVFRALSQTIGTVMEGLDGAEEDEAEEEKGAAVERESAANAKGQCYHSHLAGPLSASVVNPDRSVIVAALVSVIGSSSSSNAASSKLQQEEWLYQLEEGGDAEEGEEGANGNRYKALNGLLAALWTGHHCHAKARSMCLNLVERRMQQQQDAMLMTAGGDGSTRLMDGDAVLDASDDDTTSGDGGSVKNTRAGGAMVGSSKNRTAGDALRLSPYDAWLLFLRDVVFSSNGVPPCQHQSISNFTAAPHGPATTCVSPQLLPGMVGTSRLTTTMTATTGDEVSVFTLNSGFTPLPAPTPTMGGGAGNPHKGGGGSGDRTETNRSRWETAIRLLQL